ncbi:MAG: hypothetical protein KatS3mg059_0771 [Thermomicrobiales bacterium]|nr:MAG: hypothetical protein KatS3mg059_0771 [Thermomicrobiales bacterium]
MNARVPVPFIAHPVRVSVWVNLQRASRSHPKLVRRDAAATREIPRLRLGMTKGDYTRHAEERKRSLAAYSITRSANVRSQTG